MRKSINGLAAIVSYSFALDPFDQSLFVFCNRSRNKIKILYWDHNGFWLFYRRLEKGRFRWPETRQAKTSEGEISQGEVPQGEAMVVDRRQLQWLLDGLELEQRRAHGGVNASIAT